MKYLPTLISSIAALVVAVGGVLTVMQGQSHKAAALRIHDQAWHASHAHADDNAGSFDKATGETMTPYLAMIRDSAENAARDTGTALVQPTTLGRVFGQKARLVSVKALRNIPPRPAGIHEE